MVSPTTSLDVRMVKLTVSAVPSSSCLKKEHVRLTFMDESRVIQASSLQDRMDLYVIDGLFTTQQAIQWKALDGKAFKQTQGCEA
jgi:hypothetical protein